MSIGVRLCNHTQITRIPFHDELGRHRDGGARPIVLAGGFSGPFSLAAHTAQSVVWAAGERPQSRQFFSPPFNPAQQEQGV